MNHRELKAFFIAACLLVAFFLGKPAGCSPIPAHRIDGGNHRGDFVPR